MKIALIAHLKYPIAEPFPGGLEMHTHMLARRLIARGHEVTLFAAEGSDTALGLEAVCPPTGTPRGEAEEAEVARAEFNAYSVILLRIAQGGFDLVHNNSLHWLPLTACDRFTAPMLTVLHTPPFEDLERGMRQFARQTPHVIAVSQAVARMWDGVVAAEEVIPNGIELARFASPASRERQGAIWSGRIVPEKGLHLAIAAARRAGMPLRFAGPRSDPEYWETVIAPLQGPDARYLGHMGHQDLAREVTAARVAVVTPCFDEPFGLVVAEALASGTPVAGFARGALPDLVDALTGRLAEPYDVEGLARAIAQAGGLCPLECRARAERLWDVERMVSRYEAAYRRLIGADAPLAGVAA